MRIWIKLIPALAAIALLIWLVLQLGTFTASILNEFSGADVSEPDPMFAEAPETFTIPPELTEETGTVYGDNSANWTQEYHTPVDQTAAELAE